MKCTTLEEAVSQLPSGRLRLAFSGGMDSTVLLHAVVRVLAPCGQVERLTAHHMHHGLSADADLWAEHCRTTAQRLDVAFLVDRLDVGRQGNMEQAARRARYECWSAALEEDETLLLAHHANDQAETFLMRLMRGARGDLLKGIPRERALGRGRLLRPLLHLPRSLLENFARAEGLEWCEDPSNQDLERDRNFIRHKILPLLALRWPEAPALMASASESLAWEFTLLDSLLDESVEQVLEERSAVSLGALQSLPASLRLAVLRRALARIGAHSLSEAHLKEILRQSRSPADRMPDFPLGQDMSLVRFAGRLSLRRTSLVDTSARHCWRLEAALALGHGVISAAALASQEGACVSPDVRELEVRFRNGGERLRVKGVTKKVSRLMREASIEPWLREGWPLLYRGDKLVGIAGVAVDDALACDDGWLIHWTPTPTPTPTPT